VVLVVIKGWKNYDSVYGWIHDIFELSFNMDQSEQKQLARFYLHSVLMIMSFIPNKKGISFYNTCIACHMVGDTDQLEQNDPTKMKASRWSDQSYHKMF